MCAHVKVSCHIRTDFQMDCTDQTHRLEDVLTPPSATTDGCAPYHRFTSFTAPSVLYIHSHVAKLERDVCRSFLKSFNQTDNLQRSQHIWKYPR